MSKSRLRLEFKKRIRALDPSLLRSQSEDLASKMISYFCHKKGVWTLFFPLRGEPNLLCLLKRCRHIQWAFPKVESKEKMNFHRPLSTDLAGVGNESSKVKTVVHSASSGTSMSPDLLPLTEQSVPADEIEGCVVPALAYDRNGTRLGRGGGYYDRFLSNFKGLKLGVTFDEGLADETLPRESHDQAMHIVVSPKQWIEVTSEVQNGV